MVVVSLAHKYEARVVVDVTNIVFYNNIATIKAVKSFLVQTGSIESCENFHNHSFVLSLPAKHRYPMRAPSNFQVE